MNRGIQRPLRWLAATALVLAFLCDAPANAFEAHNPVEPPFKTAGLIGDLAVDLSNGNLYAARNPEPYPAASTVEVFGPGGGVPADGAPASLTGAGNFERSFPSERMNGVAVDNSCELMGLSGSECTSQDPSSGDFYVSVAHALFKYKLNSSDEYEYICAFRYFGGPGSRCLPTGGTESEVEGHSEAGRVTGEEFARENVAVDSLGDVYICGYLFGASGEAVLEFNAAGESLRAFPAPEVKGSGEETDDLAVSSTGTIYLVRYPLKTVIELKRSSPTGPVEGEATVISGTSGATGITFDQSSGELFVDLGSSVVALNGAHEVVSRFGAGVIAEGKTLAVDEGTGAGRGDVYVANEAEHVIDVFGPGVSATAPAVDTPAPTLSGVTRTSALLSGTVDTGNATTEWHLEYVAADEYRPAAANPYAAGGRTGVTKLAPAAQGTGIGPVPFTGLLAGTTYHYRLVATNAVGTAYGSDHTFTTAAATPPVVTTGAAGEVTQTGVLLSGTVDTHQLQTSYEFEVGTDTTYGGAKLFGNAGDAGVEAVTADLQYLIPGTTYHYRLVATNEDGASYGQDMTFTTPGVSASIVQPPTLAFVPSPSVVFPSVAGAITKAQGSGKDAKKRTKTGRKRRAKTKRARKKAAARRHNSRKGGAKR
jgi:hypothetical protein